MSWEDEAQKGCDRAREVRRGLEKTFERSSEEQAQMRQAALERAKRGAEELNREEAKG